MDEDIAKTLAAMSPAASQAERKIIVRGGEVAPDEFPGNNTRNRDQ